MEIKYLATLFPSMIKALLAGKRRWVLYWSIIRLEEEVAVNLYFTDRMYLEF